MEQHKINIDFGRYRKSLNLCIDSRGAKVPTSPNRYRGLSGDNLCLDSRGAGVPTFSNRCRGLTGYTFSSNLAPQCILGSNISTNK
ncbi:hypothetical protein J6590_072016 [Homalodisca vitripennis]|nr:hypothetical protein J6590_072016 [Homalodisca vitripennis]